MKNLIPLNEAFITTFEEVASAKSLERRERLFRLKPFIESRYKDYLLQKINLEILGEALISGSEEAIDLQHCYDVATIPLKKLKERIDSTQSEARCQYCGIDETSTLDHYLPKTRFPEFSMLAINLIPSCSRCNLLKGDRWLLDGKRSVLNLYFDTIPLDRFLFAKIDFLMDSPRMDFFLQKPDSVSTALFQIIRVHFDTLNLSSRFRRLINEIFSEVTIEIRNAVSVDDKLILSLLADKAVNQASVYGVNNWRSAAWHAIAESPKFVSYTRRK